MAANRSEQAKQSDDKAASADQSAGAASAKNGGSWLPLILNIVLMPALAYGITIYVLLPKLQGGKAPVAEHGGEAENAHGAPSHGSGAKSPGAKNRVAAPLSGKVLVNVAGTAGTRYLVASMTLVGKTPEFKEQVEHSDPQLRDTASSILGSKTLSDVDKPGMRNIIRAELISGFNDILGKEAVIDIYLTEFAVQ